MNNRRKLLIALGTTAYAPQALLAQAMKQPVLIGYLNSVDAYFVEAAKRADIQPALSRLVNERIDALVVMFSDVFLPELEAIVKFALAQRWPMASSLRRPVELGALLSCGGDQSATYGRAAYYVDRILKGAKPGDLPIEQSITFELVVNMKTAKALGIKIPPTIMVQATHVIE